MRKLVAIAAAVALMVGAVAPAAYAGGSTGTNVALGLASFAVFNQLVGPLLHPRPYVREVVVERPVYVAPAPVLVIPERATYATVIQYPNGRYELHGDGIYTAYQWIWIPNPAPLPPPPPPPPAPKVITDTVAQALEVEIVLGSLTLVSHRGRPPTNGTPPAVRPGLAAPATTEYDTATSTSVAHRARMGGADDAVRPGGQERRGDRRLGHAPLPGRRRRATRPHRHDRSDPGARARGHRCGRPGGGARLRGRAHAHGCAGLLGPARHLLLLARRDHGRDGELRIHAGPLRRLRQAPRHAESRARRGHRRRGDGCGHRLDVDHLPGVPRSGRVPAQGHQLRLLHRSLGPAHLRHGRAGVREAGRRGRPPRDGARAARRDPRRRHRLHDVTIAESRDARPATRRKPPRHLGGGASALRRNGRHERGRLRARRRRGGSHRRRSPGTARLPREAARPGRGDGTPRDLGLVQPAGGAGGLARLPRPARGDRRRGRADARAGAQPRAQREPLVRDHPAVRPAPGR